MKRLSTSKTVQQAIETIRDRVDSLGVSEPVIQEYGLGANQILVELPGIERSGSREEHHPVHGALEIHAVVGGPYPDEQAALASVGGALPSDQMMVHGSGAMATGSDADSVYILQRVSVVAGSDFRSADPGTNQNTGQRIVIFTLTNEAGDKFYEYTSAQCRPQHGRGAGRPGTRGRQHQERDSRHAARSRARFTRG